MTGLRNFCCFLFGVLLFLFLSHVRFLGVSILEFLISGLVDLGSDSMSLV